MTSKHSSKEPPSRNGDSTNTSNSTLKRLAELIAEGEFDSDEDSKVNVFITNQQARPSKPPNSGRVAAIAAWVTGVVIGLAAAAQFISEMGWLP